MSEYIGETTGGIFSLLQYFDLEVARRRRVLPHSFIAPLFFSIELTYRCTLKCVHCYNDSGTPLAWRSEDLSLAELMQIADYIEHSRVLGVCLSGGDPLLHRNFWQLAERLTCIPRLGRTVICNGWFVSRENAHRLAQYFTGVQFSLDGAAAETHDYIRGRPGSFQRAVEGLRYLSAYPNVKRLIGFTVMRKNVHELPALVDLAVNLGVTFVEVMPLMITGRAYRCHDWGKLLLSPEEEGALPQQVQALQNAYQGQLHIHYMNNIDLVLDSIRRGLPNMHMHVCADGTVKMLPHFSITFGNIREQPLERIWKDALGGAWHSDAIRRYVADIGSTRDLMRQARIPYVDPPIAFAELDSLASVSTITSK